MSDFINETVSNIRRQGLLKASGPVLESFKYVDRFQQKMHVVEFAVCNGAEIDNAFGYFVEVENARNTNESRCTIFFTPTFDYDVPVFAERTKKARPYSEYVCLAHIRTKIVPLDTAPESTSDVWESIIEPIDDFHALRTTVVPQTFETITKQEWDEALNVWVSQTTNLQTTGGSPTITDVGGVVTHTFYTEIKCGWFVRTVETFTSPGRSYQTTVDAYWPAVLSGIAIQAYNKKEVDGVDGGTDYFAIPQFTKEAYRGPCKALVVESWSLNPVTITEPQIMQPLPIAFQTPWVGISIGPTLHAMPANFFNVIISDDPIYETVTAQYSSFFTATTPTTWPATFRLVDEQNPARGGYLRRIITAYPPVYTP